MVLLCLFWSVRQTTLGSQFLSEIKNKLTAYISPGIHAYYNIIIYIFRETIWFYVYKMYATKHIETI